jgi:hypothetical protein
MRCNMSKNLLDVLEVQEQIDLLIKNGQGEFVEAFLGSESSCFTKKGRTNKSGIVRTLGWNNKQVEDAFKACRRILGDE